MRFLAAWARPVAVIVAVIVAVAVAACGTVSAPGGAASRPAAAKVNLTYRISGSIVHPGHGTLRCEPVGGTLPNAAAACRVLLTMKRSPFAPVPKQRLCPMVMAGDGQIVLTGTWFGRPVHRVVADGGCDLMLFGVLARILR